MLSAAKHLAAARDRPFAEFTLSGANVLRVTGCDSSNGQGFFMVHALLPGKTVGADVSCTLPILNFHDQHRPLRRRRIHARTADWSATGPSMRSPGRYIGGAPIHCAPTGHYRCCLV